MDVFNSLLPEVVLGNDANPGIFYEGGRKKRRHVLSLRLPLDIQKLLGSFVPDTHQGSASGVTPLRAPFHYRIAFRALHVSIPHFFELATLLAGDAGTIFNGGSRSKIVLYHVT